MIKLPYNLFHRIRVSCEEHGGIGPGDFWDSRGFPICIHAHAWGTQERQRQHDLRRNVILLMLDTVLGRSEPELSKYISFWRHDFHLIGMGIRFGQSISFQAWCEIFDVRCERPPSTECSPVSLEFQGTSQGLQR